MAAESRPGGNPALLPVQNPGFARQEGQKYSFFRFGHGQRPATGGHYIRLLLEIAPYHWADSNRDHKISDEEILSAYDYYSEAAEMGINFDLIEEIWSASGYKWDPVSQTFSVVQ